MRQLIGLVCTNYNDSSFGALTKERPVASLPFGGRYRLVDFPLSNMVNSGINTVGLTTPYMYRSIMDHVGVGKEWALSRKEGGMFILPGSIYGYKNIQGQFLMRDLLRNIEFLERADSGSILAVSGARKVFNIDYRDAAKEHERSGAEITLICTRAENRQGMFVTLDDGGRVTEMEERSGDGLLFIDSFLIDTALLLKLAEWYDALGYLDLTEIIRQNLPNIRTSCWKFRGYVGCVDSLSDYMRCNMDLLHHSVRRELFMSGGTVRTKIQDSPPAKYMDGARVSNALISSGCIIRGTVENSVIFRGVTVEKGAFIKNSIVMQGGTVGAGAVLENVISDKYAHVSPGVSLIGVKDNPVVIGKYMRI